MITASDDGSTRVWDLASGEQKTVLRREEVAFAALSPNGQSAATVVNLNPKIARIWNVASGEQTTVLRGHTGYLMNVAFSPDGKRVVTASDDGTARVWNADGSGEPLISWQVMRAPWFQPSSARTANAW